MSLPCGSLEAGGSVGWDGVVVDGLVLDGPVDVWPVEVWPVEVWPVEVWPLVVWPDEVEPLEDGDVDDEPDVVCPEPEFPEEDPVFVEGAGRGGKRLSSIVAARVMDIGGTLRLYPRIIGGFDHLHFNHLAENNYVRR